jgi:hypothetical protein
MPSCIYKHLYLLRGSSNRRRECQWIQEDNHCQFEDQALCSTQDNVMTIAQKTVRPSDDPRLIAPTIPRVSPSIISSIPSFMQGGTRQWPEQYFLLIHIFPSSPLPQRDGGCISRSLVCAVSFAIENVPPFRPQEVALPRPPFILPLSSSLFISLSF